jgi:transcriptional regulator GlxA family with amidase domain
MAHVRRAERLLRETPLSILNVAQKSGFTSIHTFETAFQSVNRCSPSQYRRKHLTTAE